MNMDSEKDARQLYAIKMSEKSIWLLIIDLLKSSIENCSIHTYNIRIRK